jgi:hypothetical protein
MLLNERAKLPNPGGNRINIRAAAQASAKSGRFGLGSGRKQEVRLTQRQLFEILTAVNLREAST